METLLSHIEIIRTCIFKELYHLKTASGIADLLRNNQKNGAAG